MNNKDTGAIVLYRPSNGEEGRRFENAWCAKCKRDQGAEWYDGCGILGDTMIFDVDDPAYPREWREDGPEGPRCTAFDPINVAEQPRCRLTGDLFA